MERIEEERPVDSKRRRCRERDGNDPATEREIASEEMWGSKGEIEKEEKTVTGAKNRKTEKEFFSRKSEAGIRFIWKPPHSYQWKLL